MKRSYQIQSLCEVKYNLTADLQFDWCVNTLALLFENYKVVGTCDQIVIVIFDIKYGSFLRLS